MGQYYVVVNLDKKQYLMPHAFGDGLKLMEFGCSAQGTLLALAVLLADGNNRGGGDLHSDNPIIGSWAGDRIVVAGDYADKDKFLEPHQQVGSELVRAGHTLYSHAEEFFENVSEKVGLALIEDSYVKQDWADRYHEERNGMKSWFAGMAKEYMPKVARKLAKVKPSKKQADATQTALRPDMVVGV